MCCVPRPSNGAVVDIEPEPFSRGRELGGRSQIRYDRSQHESEA